MTNIQKKYPLWEGTGAQDPLAIGNICKFFDDIGILLHRKLIDIGMVDELFGFWVKITWEKVKFVIEGRRKDINQHAIYKWFEYLYNEMKKREEVAVIKSESRLSFSALVNFQFLLNIMFF